MGAGYDVIMMSPRIALRTCFIGLKESVEKMVKNKKSKFDEETIHLLFVYLFTCLESEGLSPWEQYLQEKKERRKAAKQKRLQARAKATTEENSNTEQIAGDAGFDDPFFHHSVTTATAVSGYGSE